MRFSSSLFFLWRNMRQHPFRTLLSSSTIMVATVFLFLLISLAGGISKSIYPQIEAAFPEKEIMVKPKTATLAFFELSKKNLNTEMINKIKEIPGVDKVMPVLPLRIPIRLEVSIVGQMISSDFVLYGVDPDLVANDIQHKRGFDFQATKKGDEIPIVVSEFLLDIFNSGYAEANGLPKVSRASAIGRHFDIILSESTMTTDFNSDNEKRYRCVVVGLTPRSSPIGAMVPIQYVQYFHQKEKKRGDYFNQAFVVAKTLDDYDSIKKVLETMDLTLTSGRDILRRIRAVIIAGIGILALAAIAIIAQALFGLFNAFSLILNERHYFISIMRSLGATSSGIRKLLLSEALAVGLIGGIVGCLVGDFIGMIINETLNNWLDTTFVKLDEIFLMGGMAWFLSITLAIIGATLTPIVLIWRKTDMPPSVLMSERK